MCILLALRRERAQPELWVAANRDELLARPWQRPALLVEGPLVFGGRDLVGGGSWLAVNLQAGFVVGVTNAHLGAPPAKRSRGRLVLDVASSRTLTDARALLSELELRHYGAFNLLLADPRDGWLATNSPAPEIVAGAAPVLAIGNDPLAAPGERVAATGRRGRELAALDEDELTAAMQRVLADHQGVDPLCRHGERYGTVCSTIIGMREGAVVCYLFAPGRPCTTPFERMVIPGAASPSDR